MTSEKILSFEVLRRFVKKSVIHYFKDEARSILIQGSGSRDEVSVYTGKNKDIMVSNLGFIIVSDFFPKSVISKYLLIRFLRGLEKSSLREQIQKPLVLVKPFEITVIPYSLLAQNHVPPDLWTFEVRKTGRVIYGENVLQLFNPNFELDAGYRLLINRLFGLNLCLPLILRSNFNDEVKTVTVNYESVKGILGCLESLCILLNEYRPTYSQRSSLCKYVIQNFSDEFETPQATLELFKMASKMKLNPNGLADLSPTPLWFESRNLLARCMEIYANRMEKVRTSKQNVTMRVNQFIKFILNGELDARPFMPFLNISQYATKLMLSSVFSVSSNTIGETSEKLVETSKYSNFLHTCGDLREIDDRVQYIQPKRSCYEG